MTDAWLSKKPFVNAITAIGMHFVCRLRDDAYISRHRAEFGDLGLTATLSDHSNLRVVDKHYNAQIDAIKKSANFSVFSDEMVGVN